MKRSAWSGATKWLALVLLATLLPLTPSPARSQDPDSPPVIPDPPPPMPIPSGTPEEQALAFADALDATPDNVAAWLGLYDALDIPVIAPDGTSLGVENADPIGPAYWEVWYTSAATPAIGISLQDFGQLIALAMDDTDTSHDYGALLLQDLRASAISTDPHSQLLALFVAERMTRGGLSPLDEAVTPDQLTVDPAVVVLLGWEVIRAGVVALAAQSTSALPNADAAFKLTNHPLSSQPARTSFGDACLDDSEVSNESRMQGWVEYAVEQIQTDKRNLTNALQNITIQLGPQIIQEVGQLPKMQHVMPAGYMLAILLAGFQLEVSASPSPFVRTKSQGEWGESSELKLTLNFSPDFLPSGDVRILCAAYYSAKSFGGTFNPPPTGPLNGARLIATLQASADRVGFSSDTALENNTRIVGTADVSGQVITTVKGRPQTYEIPETAAKVDMEYSMVVLLDLEELTALNGDTMLTVGGTTLLTIPAGTDTPLTQALSQMKSRFRLGRYKFPFQDWQPQQWRALLGDQPSETVVCDFTEPVSINATVQGATYAIELTPNNATSGTFSETLGYGGTPGFEITGTYSLTFIERGGLEEDEISVDMQATEVCGLFPVRQCVGIPTIETARLIFISIGACEPE